jgi:hypothetical protein
LVRKHQVHPVLPQLRQHVGQAQSSEVLKLVDVDVEIAALPFRHVGAPETGKPDAGDEQRTQPPR